MLSWIERTSAYSPQSVPATSIPDSNTYFLIRFQQTSHRGTGLGVDRGYRPNSVQR